jgi:hypothetical protein
VNAAAEAPGVASGGNEADQQNVTAIICGLDAYLDAHTDRSNFMTCI